MADPRKGTTVLTLAEAGRHLDLSAEAIRRRIRKGEIKARYDRGSPKLGWIIERDEYVRYLRSIGEDQRADDVERGFLPN
jgi:hypothetical protein